METPGPAYDRRAWCLNCDFCSLWACGVNCCHRWISRGKLRFLRQSHDWACFWRRDVRVLAAGSGPYRRAVSSGLTIAPPDAAPVNGCFRSMLLRACQAPKWPYLAKLLGAVKRPGKTLELRAASGGAWSSFALNSRRSAAGLSRGRFSSVLMRSDALAEVHGHKALCACRGRGRGMPSALALGGNEWLPPEEQGLGIGAFEQRRFG